MREVGLPLVLTLVGLIAVAAVLVAVRSRRRWRTWPRAAGTILERRRNQAYEVSFNVLVAFRTREGSDVRAWSSDVIGIESSPTVGSAVEVAYDPADPQHFEVRPAAPPRPTSWWVWAIFVLAFGGAFFFIWLAWF